MLIKIWSRRKKDTGKKENFLDNIKNFLENFLATENTKLVFDVISDSIEIKIGNVNLNIAIDSDNINLGKLKIRRIEDKKYEISYDKNSQDKPANKDLAKLLVLFYNLENLYIDVNNRTISNFGLLLAIIIITIVFLAKKQ